MAKEVLLYGDIYDYTAQRFITALSEANGGDVSVRVNSSGGGVAYGYGMIAKYSEHTGKKTVKVDGMAKSMAAMFVVYSDYAEALDVSEFMFHRAGWPDWMEADASFFTESRKAEIENINKSFRSAIESKVTAERWQAVTGVSLDQMFSLDSRVDVRLNAQQALDLGLIQKINKVTPKDIEARDSRMLAVAEDYTGMRLAAKADPTPTPTNPNSKTMTIEKFKAEHPEIYAQAVTAGAEQERDRVSAWMTYVDIDAKAVADGITAGKNITQTAMAELSRKALSKEALAGAAADNAPAVTTTEPESKDKGEDAAAMEAFRAEYAKELGLKTNKA